LSACVAAAGREGPVRGALAPPHLPALVGGAARRRLGPL